MSFPHDLLPEVTNTGVRNDVVVRFMGWSLRIYKIVLKNKELYANVPEFNGPCIYIGYNNRRVYVGESDPGFVNRSSSGRHKKLERCMDAIVIVDEELGHTDMRRFGEGRIIDLVKKEGNYELLNSNSPRNVPDKKHIRYIIDKVLPCLKYIAPMINVESLFGKFSEIENSNKPNSAKEILRNYIKDVFSDTRKLKQLHRNKGHSFTSKVAGHIDDGCLNKIYMCIFWFGCEYDYKSFEFSDYVAEKMDREIDTKWEKSNHKLSLRELYVRMYLNIACKLGFLEIVSNNPRKYRITRWGFKFLEDAVDEKTRRTFFSVGVENYRGWFGLNIRECSRNVERILGQKMSEREFKLFGCHVTKSPFNVYNTISDIAELINLFNSEDISESDRVELEAKYDKIVKKIDESSTQSSLGNSRSNVSHNYNYIVLQNNLSDETKSLLIESRKEIYMPDQIDLCRISGWEC